MSAALGLMAPAGTSAQTVQEQPLPNVGLDLPDGLTLFGNDDPNVRRATAVVNGSIITGTDVDQRMALILTANGGQVPEAERNRLRLQVLRNLIDETLQIQEAAANDISISSDEIAQTYGRVAQQNGQGSAVAFDQYLRSIGSAPASLHRQIQAELAWSRLLRRNVSPFINVSDDEVQSIIDRLNESRGTTEYRLGEIYLAATPENEAQVVQQAQNIVKQISEGGSFVAYARQFSEASTAAVGGDLGWVRPAQLPTSLAEAAQQMQANQLVGPIPSPGGMSILYLIDKRQILTADPRDAQLSLKQISIKFPAGASQAAAQPILDRFAQATQEIQGCGNADEVAATLNADVVNRDGVRLGDLPGPLQETMSQLQIGRSTPPYGALDEGVRVFVLCGRDDPKTGAEPSFDQIQNRLEEDRVSRRAQIYLRDLRRDAIIDYN
ncbi:MAG: peptidylprolyl isomerase [Novosphingopyxis baekryungensis]|uniref:peptidylprolyl isomerase n=1 Tax=Novosphingopyxis baekryungensis TaxID=279369 RepID=UPI000425342D|nr:peptidylprolyl isomerase [Novosphingopyxis baekryungensis]MDE0934057.1 peptidylprolyl isomerase [Novosphingopyxis baekryungensis]